MRIQTTVDRANLTVTAHSKLMRQVMEMTGRRHIDKRVGKHFRRIPETAVGGAYGFAPRSKRTKEMKRRKGVDPHRPNFFTGALRDFIIRMSKLTRTQHKWSWSAKSPFALPDRRRDEIEAISKAEIASDTKFMEKKYVELAAKAEFSRKRSSKRG